jgi:hypothetical protein
MNTTNSQQQSYEEIDLLELIIKIYKFFKKRILLILAVMIACVGLGALSSYLVFRPRYQSTMIFQSRSMTASEVVGVTSMLNDLVREENYNEIEKLTGLPKDIAKNLEKLEAAPNREIQKNIDKDIRKDSTLALTIEITDNENLEKIQQGLINYFENLPYVKKRKQLFREGKERLLAQIQKDIKHTDSLKRIVEASLTAKNPIILNSNSGFSKDLLLLYEAESKVKEELAFSDDITVVKGFTRYQKARKFSINDTLGISALIGFIVGVLWSLIIELNKIIRDRESLAR